MNINEDICFKLCHDSDVIHQLFTTEAQIHSQVVVADLYQKRWQWDGVEYLS
jgi:hypothetical protein